VAPGPAGALGWGRHPASAGRPSRCEPWWSGPHPSSARSSASSHPQLANPQIRAVFDGLDGRIRALDPNVSQEVRKLCIAYKAETNFVDIVPQAKRLRLSLNTLEEVPYALGLIHQSLERQLEGDL